MNADDALFSTEGVEQPLSCKDTDEVQQQQHFDALRILEKAETTTANPYIVNLLLF